MKPNFWNRIFHYKRWKPLYFVRGFWRYYVTAGWAKLRLKALLAEARRRPDWDYIRQRVDYYNRLPQLPSTPEALRPLTEHRVGSIQSAYFFDSHEFTRYFPNHLRWAIEPGDVTEVPAVPAILKSRPVEGRLFVGATAHRHITTGFRISPTFVPAKTPPRLGGFVF